MRTSHISFPVAALEPVSARGHTDPCVPCLRTRDNSYNLLIPSAFHKRGKWLLGDDRNSQAGWRRCSLSVSSQGHWRWRGDKEEKLMAPITGDLLSILTEFVISKLIFILYKHIKLLLLLLSASAPGDMDTTPILQGQLETTGVV